MGAQIVGLDGSPVQQLPGSWDGSFGLRLSPDRGTDRLSTSRPTRRPDRRWSTGAAVRSTSQESRDTNAGGDAHGRVSSWSPDGTRLAYAYRTHDIYVRQRPTVRVERKLTDSYAGHRALLPGLVARRFDDRVLGAARPRERTAAPQPRTQRSTRSLPTAERPTRLTHNDVNDIQPTWAPDSSQIAYFSAGELWVMNADGTHQRRVYELGNVWAPAWSPDGTKIAFIDLRGQPSVRNGTPIGPAPPRTSRRRRKHKPPRSTC